MWNYLREIPEHFRPADLGDILLFSVVLFGVLSWLRRSASTAVFVLLSLLALIYVVAQAFDMFLMSMLFHGLFAVSLIGLVILFQDDLRRMLQRTAGWRWISSRRPLVDSSETDTLVEVCFTFAAYRTGALIVLKGREALDRHIEGGVLLGGQISKPLFYSLFDPHSPGHDGAAIIDEGVVSRFSAHLPLSRNRGEIGTLGTRHSAALGLSERTDVLVLTCSEERGVVSIAEAGKLQIVHSPTELKRRIEQFRADRFPQQSPQGWRHQFGQYWGLSALAFGLSCVLWVLFAYQPGTFEETYRVPIEYRNMPQELVIGRYTPTHADVTLSGTSASFTMLDQSKLKISLNLESAEPNRTEYSITPDDVIHPYSLKVARIEPSTVLLQQKPVDPPPSPSPTPLPKP